ncbi:MAG: carbamoyl phosphate synthase small subunit [Rhodospirillaceae bacterium]|nr:carbamoyl phosphate synthase small subunit [Rhodospirillaceae bacterium]|tara:strand:- start:1050 stop:2204 length:1155 start_codon:yes stop_codon:yes gene_type:complete
MTTSVPAPAPWATASLVLADGTVFWGRGLGAKARAIGEICFNTSMTGYQEILTDSSYAGQIITFTFPHIGNVGANTEDIESDSPAARGLVMRADITEPSNFRSIQHLDRWLAANNLVGIVGIDTRRLTRLIRDQGFQTAGIQHGEHDIDGLAAEIAAWPGLEGMDLAKYVTCRQTYTWDQTGWVLGQGYGTQSDPKHKVVAVDYGVKKNILRCLASLGCDVAVVPASASFDDIMRHEPDGIFLSNGPGDPAATGDYAVPVIRALVESGKPVFGICLGHQMLALALGAQTMKMANGHRGANHPIKNLETGTVEITSQNHGFVVDADSLPAGVSATHVSLFDGTLAGLKVEGKPVFSVQYHPEASPGPQDSRYLFENFVAAMEAHA